MDYLVTELSFQDNKLIFKSEVDITELCINDQQLLLTKKDGSLYVIDFDSVSTNNLDFGRFHILAKINGDLVRLKNNEFKTVPESDRYFSIDGKPGVFVYTTINGYLNFAFLASSSYLKIVDRSYDNFNYEKRDIIIDKFDIENNVVTFSNIPIFNKVIVISHKDENEYSIPFIIEKGIAKIDFSMLLNAVAGRYFVFLKIAEKNIRVRFPNILKSDVQNRYFELKKKYSVLNPNLDNTQKYLYFSVNGRLAFLKSPQSTFHWPNYTGLTEVRSIQFNSHSNDICVELPEAYPYESKCSLELRDGENIVILCATKKISNKLIFNFENVQVNSKNKYLISLKFVNTENEIYNSLLKINNQIHKVTCTKSYTVNQYSKHGLIFLSFNDKQFYYTQKKNILAKFRLMNEHKIVISPETFVFVSDPQIIAQSRTSKNTFLLDFEKKNSEYVVDIQDIIGNNQNEIFDIYCLIDNEKFDFKNTSALSVPVRRRYQEKEVNDYRLSLYSTLGGTLAFRKDEIDEENRQLYKYRTDDLVVDNIKNNENFVEIHLPDKVIDVMNAFLLPRKGTDLKDTLDIKFDKETKIVKIINLNTVRASQTKKLFNYFADYLLDWVDENGVVHTSYLKSKNFELINKPLRKFKPYKPQNENYVLVQNYLNGAHNLSVQIKNLYYSENYGKVSLDNNLVLYESRDGKSFVDSPLSIFQYLVSHEKYKDLKHVVVFDDLKGEAAEYNKRLYGNKIILVERNTEEYARYLLTAKYLINNSTFQSYFLKQDKQIYVNTWHGTPLKLMGMEMTYPANASQNVLRNFLMSDYVVAQNDRMFDMYTKSYRMNGIYSGRITKFGYPRMDSLIKGINENPNKLSEFGIRINKELPTILYAPTHNGQNESNPGDGVLNFVNDLVRLRSYFAQDYNVLIKVHPFVYDLVKDNEWLRGALIPDYLDTNYVLQFADILVTDFSSIFVDFLGRNKRIIFFVPNFEDYIKERGVYDDVSNWPGEVISSLSELRESLERDEKSEYVAERQRAIDYYLKFDDGEATKKLVEVVFDQKAYENMISVQNDKKNILIYPGGMVTNGITSVALNLTSKIDHDKYNVFILINARNINEEDQLANYLSIDEKNIPIFIFGKNIFDIKSSILDYEYRTFGVPQNERVPATDLYSKETKRLLPNTNIHSAIDFSGYSYYYTRYIIGANADNRLVYLHNDLYADARKSIDGEFPHYHNLSVLFTAYKYFNQFINVSKSSEKVNRKNLNNFVDVSRMTTVDNPLAIDSIIQQSNEMVNWDNIETIDGVEVDFLNQRFTTFITAARLSPEKNQLNLVKAFAEFVKEHPNNRLFILGDGPLKQELKNMISRTKSENNIFMLGRIANPMPFIRNSDVFVLPSLYEGQPMSMMEAMTLGVKYILSSNIPQSVELLEGGRLGYLTEGTSQEDILLGLKNVRNKEYEKFDPYAHNQKSMKAFYEKID